MRSILKSSANRARQTPRRSGSKRRDMRSNRSCSPAAFSSKGKDPSLTLRNHQKANSPTREPRKRPGAWEKKTWQGSRHLEASPNRAQWTISGAVRVVGSADERGALLGLREGSGAAISVPVSVSTKEAGGGAEEECEGRRGEKKQSSRGVSHDGEVPIYGRWWWWLSVLN